MDDEFDLLTRRIALLEAKVNEISDSCKSDHDTTILSDERSKLNKIDIDKMGSFVRKINVKLIYVSVGVVLLSFGADVIVMNILGKVL